VRRGKLIHQGEKERKTLYEPLGRQLRSNLEKRGSTKLKEGGSGSQQLQNDPN